MRSLYVIWILSKKELSSNLFSPIAFIIAAVFMGVFGYYFYSIIRMSETASLRMVFSAMSLILVFIIPIITMRSFAEEKKAKTLPLLLSSPVHLKEIIFGKFLSCMIVVATMLLLSSYSIIFLLFLGEPEVGPILTGYLGILLMSGCYVSIGVFASSLTDNQIIAAVLAFGFSLFMWIIGWGAHSSGSAIGDVLQYLSLIDHIDHFMKGILDTSDLIYYVSFIGFGLFLTHRVLDSQRWR